MIIFGVGLYDYQDWLRLINFGLGIAAFFGFMFDRYGAWRDSLSTEKLLAYSISGMFLWTGYAGFEVLLLSHGPSPGALGDGVRVLGNTFWIGLGLVALLVRRARRKRAEVDRLHEPPRHDIKIELRPEGDPDGDE